MRSGRTTRGFTLIEAMSVVAIIGVLASLAVYGFTAGSRRAKARNAAFELTSLFPMARARAAGTATAHYVALYERNGRFGAVLFDLPAGTAVPAWASANLSDVTTFGGREVEEMDLTPSTGATIRPLASLGFGNNLPAPFSSISLQVAASPSALRQGCSFCVNSDTGAVGVLRYLPGGTLQVLTRPNPLVELTGGAIAIGETNGPAGNSRLIAVAAPMGALRVY